MGLPWQYKHHQCTAQPNAKEIAMIFSERFNLEKKEFEKLTKKKHKWNLKKDAEGEKQGKDKLKLDELSNEDKENPCIDQ